mmetsp:Transcript_130480/g.229736  ORF Transcript_130480/g.229736 Transcript_130480/m.229736 type:complete len:205 (+) Transcript_130480:41-655(+)
MQHSQCCATSRHGCEGHPPEDRRRVNLRSPRTQATRFSATGLQMRLLAVPATLTERRASTRVRELLRRGPANQRSDRPVTLRSRSQFCSRTTFQWKTMIPRLRAAGFLAGLCNAFRRGSPSWSLAMKTLQSLRLLQHQIYQSRCIQSSGAWRLFHQRSCRRPRSLRRHSLRKLSARTLSARAIGETTIVLGDLSCIVLGSEPHW